MFNLLALAILILVVSILYDRYIQKFRADPELELYNKIQKYLLNDSTVAKKSIIWIHIPYRYNSRNWTSFFSRSSYNLNQPYQYLTIESIIKNNPKFHICLIDDESFNHLIPGWVLNISEVAEPSKNKVRFLAILKLLHLYGGINVPSSFLSFRSFDDLYKICTDNNRSFVVQTTNNTLKNCNYIPDHTFIGADKECPLIQEFIQFLEINISNDFTSQSEIIGSIQNWCSKKVAKGELDLVSSKLVGLCDQQNKPITLDNWFENKYIKLSPNMYGIHIPQDELLKRTNLNWFCYLDPEEIYKTDNLLAKHFVLAAK